jgi:hypothetical protein
MNWKLEISKITLTKLFKTDGHGLKCPIIGWNVAQNGAQNLTTLVISSLSQKR